MEEKAMQHDTMAPFAALDKQTFQPLYQSLYSIWQTYAGAWKVETTGAALHGKGGGMDAYFIDLAPASIWTRHRIDHCYRRSERLPSREVETAASLRDSKHFHDRDAILILLGVGGPGALPVNVSALTVIAT